MKTTIKIGLLALVAAATPGLAFAGNDIQIKTLADASGLSERQVRMVVGPARTPYAEYRRSYDRVKDQLIEAVGEQRYEELVAGRPVRFERVVDGQLVVTIVQLAPST